MGETNHAKKSELISGASTCRLCRQTFAAAPLMVSPSNPTAVNNPAAQASLDLMRHLMTKHTKVDVSMQTQAAQFLGMLRLSAFRLADDSVARQRDYLRWYAHQATLNARVADEKIKAKAEELAATVVEFAEAKYFPTAFPSNVDDNLRKELSAIVSELIAGTLRELRNELQEPERYPNGPDTLFSELDKTSVTLR